MQPQPPEGPRWVLGPEPTVLPLVFRELSWTPEGSFMSWAVSGCCTLMAPRPQWQNTNTRKQIPQHWLWIRLTRLLITPKSVYLPHQTVDVFCEVLRLLIRKTVGFSPAVITAFLENKDSQGVQEVKVSSYRRRLRHPVILEFRQPLKICGNTMIYFDFLSKIVFHHKENICFLGLCRWGNQSLETASYWLTVGGLHPQGPQGRHRWK